MSPACGFAPVRSLSGSTRSCSGAAAPRALPYDGRPVDEHALAELSAIAAEFGHQASFTSDPALVDWVLSLNADTVFYDLDEDDRREEIGPGRT